MDKVKRLNIAHVRTVAVYLRQAKNQYTQTRGMTQGPTNQRCLLKRNKSKKQEREKIVLVDLYGFLKKVKCKICLYSGVLPVIWMGPLPLGNLD